MERESMPMSAPDGYYMPRGMNELHGPQGVHSLSSSGMPYQPNIGGNLSGPGLMGEPTSTVLSDGRGVGGAPSSMQLAATPMRRKRGRPRKYGVEGKMSLNLSSVSAAPRALNTSTEKRGRGRPPGSGRKQLLAPFGKLVSGSAGGGFTPHVILVATGEDIGSKLLAFAQQGPRAVCILSANGSVSTATLRQPSTSSGTITYEGRFDILCLTGSFLHLGTDDYRDRSGGISISLVSPDGRVIGGAVGGMLIAASPVQVIVGSFMCNTPKTNQKMKEGNEGGVDSEHYTVNNTMMGPPSGRQSQNLSSPTSSMGGWAAPQTLDIQKSHMDIDLMRG
ncbi:AT-hook motif nuclear-localized protein 9 [Amaranthus tricolor]|uniref:AT-hook motif nuclear-localized protein 9 n=1 Tax=Amaranthus tricolor TaxID=29722 RepID=UPI00258845AD|nr:AT-hook motif nuclear-localized protein 9 [Amaranthus tricolor]XP_057533518.1 AT-hook motif nuclear-localized protein 9 [Amaranthus tricolor]XP_057533519.1 AT-hook motif nuclear-localized protein 9 [Amaranthus tricolor]XP_057533520.1 AT-hook motif nuclear-localized protein 9 [Amaranthus tricolor]